MLLVLLLLLLMKLVTGGGLGRDRLASVITMLLKSCTVFAAGLSGSLKITVSRFVAHCFHLDHGCRG